MTSLVVATASKKCASIARAVASWSRDAHVDRHTGANTDSKIYRGALEQFFSLAATTFGQCSDGRKEASSLIDLLRTHASTNSAEAQDRQNIPQEVQPRGKRAHMVEDTQYVVEDEAILECVFCEYLVQRFSSHPEHLEELAQVAKDFEKRQLKQDIHGRENNENPGPGRQISNTFISQSIHKEKLTHIMPPKAANNDSENAKLIETIACLKKQIASQDAKIKEVTDHHQRVLKAALTAARVERTKALKSGLTELQEKVKRLSTERAKRDAQIVRLRTQLKNAQGSSSSSPVVSRSRRSPGRLSSPGRVRPQTPNIDDIFEIPPKIGGRFREESLRQSQGRIQTIFEVCTRRCTTQASKIEHGADEEAAEGKQQRRTRNEERWWEEAVLGNTAVFTADGDIIDLATASASQLFDLAQKQMEILSQVSMSPVEDVSLSTHGSSDRRDSAENVERVSRVISLRNAAMCYHADQAMLLSSHAASRAAASKDRLLRAKCFVQMSRALDMTHNHLMAIEYAERAVQLFKALGLEARASSSSLHVMILCLELQDLDKAEVTAMKLQGASGCDAAMRGDLGDCLSTIRSAIEHGMRVIVNREGGWPCRLHLDTETN